MADSLSTIGSIASYIASSVNFISAGISGNLVPLVDLSRQYVSQYTGANIGSNSIPENYQAPIVNFAMSDVIRMILSEGEVTLDALSYRQGGALMSSEQYKLIGENQLKLLGRNLQYARVLS